MQEKKQIEIWGGLECTLNRVKDTYHDQLDYTGFYHRKDDIDTIAGLGITTLRYPVLWERHQPQQDTVIDWSFSKRNLSRLRKLNIRPIVGLVHHGSGPRHVSFLDESFANGLADYAALVAEKFPWIEYYTPVNEPLTTARFCGLYGHWFPHAQDEHSFYTILLSECKATVKAMQAIRRINPHAKLVQTEDLGKTYSTPLLQYQAQYDNHRRWITFDLLCGSVNEQHPLWKHLTTVAGIAAADLYFFLENPCPPDICGLNYYMTSERYLDEQLEQYPAVYHSGNGQHRFADLERVRVDLQEDFGAKSLLKEAYDHLQLPIAITECHLHCTRDEQMRWFSQMYQTAYELQQEGVDIRAVTAWALLGTYGWDKLMMDPMGTYETGAFKVTDGPAKPTVFASLLQTLSAGNTFHHPVLHQKGWWQRDIRMFYGLTEAAPVDENAVENSVQPLLVIGEEGKLSEGFHHICFERNLPLVFINQDDYDLSDRSIVDDFLQQHQPWAVILIKKYQKLPKEKSLEQDVCAFTIAAACKNESIKLTCFYPEPTVKGTGPLLYNGNHEPTSLCIYDASFTRWEQEMLTNYPNTLLLRTGKLFSSWGDGSTLHKVITNLPGEEIIIAEKYSSFAYVPDVVHIGIDWLLDGETGVHYMANSYHVNAVYLAAKVAQQLGKNPNDITGLPANPQQRNLQLLPMNHRIKLPPLDHALQRYVETVRRWKIVL